MFAALESLADVALSAIRLFGLPALLVIFLLKGVLLGKIIPTSVCLPGYVLGIGASYTEALVVAVLVTAAYLVGQLVVYCWSRRYGSSLFGMAPSVGPESDDRLTAWFDRYGGLAVVVTNLVPWTRGLIAVPAGVASYPISRYSVFASTAALLAHVVYAVGPVAGLAIVS